MAKSTPLSHQQGLAYAVALHGVLQDASRQFKCPEAQVLTLLGVHSVNEASEFIAATTRELHQVVRVSLPLLRAYVRALEARGYVKRVRLFHPRAARLLQLTYQGQDVAHYCQRQLARAAGRVVEWRSYQ